MVDFFFLLVGVVFLLAGVVFLLVGVDFFLRPGVFGGLLVMLLRALSSYRNAIIIISRRPLSLFLKTSFKRTNKRS